MGAMIGDAPGVKAGDAAMFFRKPKAGASPFLRQSAATNMNPRALNRLGSITQLSGDQKLGYYTPFQGMPGAVNWLAKKSPGLRKAFGIGEGDLAYSGGVLGRLTSMSKISKMESQIARLNKITSSGGKLSGMQERKLAKLMTQRGQVVQNITRVQEMTGGIPSAVQIARRSPTAAMGTETAAERLAKARVTRAGIIEDIAANPLKATSSTMTSGKISNAITKYVSGVMDSSLMTRGQKVVGGRVYARLNKTGISKGVKAFTEEFATGGKYAGGFFRELRGGGKMLGSAFEYALEKGGSKMVAAKMAGMGATKIGAAMLPGLNVLATASMLYDIGKGIGKIAVAGQNFAKDALKSMQGSINKPLFGAGFVDNEVSASSRARGVMAIQNSRLNARSLLGSEASMMAAHFG